MSDLKVSTTCIRLILKFETWKHKAYDDGYGYVTIGVGNRTSKPKPNTTITSEMVWWLFVQDLKDVEKVVDDNVKVPLNQNEYDALVSFVFNVGSTAFKRSTLLRLLNEQKRTAAAKQFARWCMVKGTKSSGLTKRRQYERQLFEGIEPEIA
jgi:lysozyme